MLNPKLMPNSKDLNNFSLLTAVGLVILWAIIPAYYLIQGQDANWDLQNYHLYNTISIIEDPTSSDIAPAGMQTYYNPLVSLPAYLIHRVASTPGESFWYGFGLASFQGLCGPIVFKITQLLIPCSNVIAFFIALFGITSPILLSEAGSSMADLTICVLQMSAIYFCLSSLTLFRRHRSIAMSIGWGILGAACGIKFSAIFSLPLTLAISLISLRDDESFTLNFSLFKRLVYTIVIPVFLGFTIFGVMWFTRSWTDNGNPLYPLFSSIFGDSKMFTTDNHDDNRFVVSGFVEYFTAPFLEFINKPMQRSEVAYRDMRPMLWMYLNIASLSVASYNFSRKKEKKAKKFNAKLATLLGFQSALIVSYVIWISEAGIARYSIHMQVLSGASIYISLLLLTTQEDVQTLIQNNSRLLTTKSRNFYIFAFLLAISIITTQVPNWGRTSFQVRWNSLKPVGSSKEFSSTQYLLDKNNDSNKNTPIVLVDKPLGWLKQFSPSGQQFSLVDDYLKADYIQTVKSNIISKNGKFITIGLLDKNKLSANKAISLTKHNFKFRTSECQDYTTPTNQQIRKCLSVIEKEEVL